MKAWISSASPRATATIVTSSTSEPVFVSDLRDPGTRTDPLTAPSGLVAALARLAGDGLLGWRVFGCALLPIGLLGGGRLVFGRRLGGGGVLARRLLDRGLASRNL